MIRRVVVKRMFNGVLDEQYPDAGVFYEEQGVVVAVDPYGLVEVFNAKPIEGTDVVIVEQDAECLSSDNQEYVVSLLMSSVE